MDGASVGSVGGSVFRSALVDETFVPVDPANLSEEARAMIASLSEEERGAVLAGLGTSTLPLPDHGIEVRASRAVPSEECTTGLNEQMGNAHGASEEESTRVPTRLASDASHVQVVLRAAPAEARVPRPDPTVAELQRDFVALGCADDAATNLRDGCLFHPYALLVDVELAERPKEDVTNEIFALDTVPLSEFGAPDIGGDPGTHPFGLSEGGSGWRVVRR